MRREHVSATRERGEVPITDLDITRAIYQRFGQGDIPGVLELLDPAVDWIWYGPETIPWAGHYRSRDEMVSFFAAIGAHVTVEAYEPREFLPGEAGIVTVLGWQRVRVNVTGKAWETHWAHVWSLRHGLVVRAREFYNTAAIAEAFQPTRKQDLEA